MCFHSMSGTESKLWKILVQTQSVNNSMNGKVRCNLRLELNEGCRACSVNMLKVKIACS